MKHEHVSTPDATLAHLVQGLGYIADLYTRRLTFTAGSSIFALRFPDNATYQGFGQELNDKVFYNT